jgi:hypothetical protein
MNGIQRVLGKVIGIAISAACATPYADTPAPCGKSMKDGGIITGPVLLKFPVDLNNEEHIRKMAKDIHSQLGGKLAYDVSSNQLTGNIELRVTATASVNNVVLRWLGMSIPFSGGVNFPLSLPYTGSVSTEKAILDYYKVDVGKPDPSPCTPPSKTGENPKQTTSGASSSGASGGSSNYQGSYSVTALPEYGYTRGETTGWVKQQIGTSYYVSYSDGPGPGGGGIGG